MNNLAGKTYPEKIDRIINSAFEEFGKNDFNKASTNEIVKNAGISKGLLFHYFGSKQQLYDYLEKFAFQTSTDFLKDKINWENGDVLERVKQIFASKSSILKRYPYFYKFLKKLISDKTSQQLRESLDPDTLKLAEKIYTYNIDFSLFRDDIDVLCALDIIRWGLEKFSEERWYNIQGADNMEEIQAELESYLVVLRTTFYK